MNKTCALNFIVSPAHHQAERGGAVKTFTEETIKFAIDNLKNELSPGGMYDEPRDLMNAYDAAAYNQFTQCKDFDRPMLERKYISLRYQTFKEEVIRRLTLKNG